MASSSNLVTLENEMHQRMHAVEQQRADLQHRLNGFARIMMVLEARGCLSDQHKAMFAEGQKMAMQVDEEMSSLMDLMRKSKLRRREAMEEEEEGGDGQWGLDGLDDGDLRFIGTVFALIVAMMIVYFSC